MEGALAGGLELVVELLDDALLQLGDQRLDVDARDQRGDGAPEPGELAQVGLEGVPVGSRVLLQIPPAFGYGSQGSGSIPPNATLWFLIDVIAAE